MITVYYLQKNDVIEPDDLYYSDNAFQSSGWVRAKFSIPHWVGRRANKLMDSRCSTIIVRTNASEKRLVSVGIFVTKPSAKTRLMYKQWNGIRGNKRDYPISMRFDFGKYKGKMVRDVIQNDQRYVEWVLREARCLTPALRENIESWME